MLDPTTELLEILMEQLGYRFSNIQLLEQAVTHRSRVNEGNRDAIEHNERLEFLGDAVIDLVIGTYLMEQLPDAREGRLSQLRSLIVNESGLAYAARALDLGSYLRLGRGEEQSGGNSKASILADAFEAIIGAIFLDGGFEHANQLVRRLLAEQADRAVSGELDRDHKTRLQELAQALLRQIPRYHVVGERGPEHEKCFEVAVHLDEFELARGEGRSKKEAEQSAASRALDSFETDFPQMLADAAAGRKNS